MVYTGRPPGFLISTLPGSAEESKQEKIMQYYAEKVKHSACTLYALKQTRYRDKPNHPHTVCAVGRSLHELKRMYDTYLSGGVDWSDVVALVEERVYHRLSLDMQDIAAELYDLGIVTLEEGRVVAVAQEE